MTTQTLVDKHQAIFKRGGEIAEHGHIISRDDIIEMLGYAIIAWVHGLLLSEPGTAKSLVLDRMMMHISDAQIFKILMAKDTEAPEVLGPPDIIAMKDERVFKRVIDKMFPTADYALVDEVFKGNSIVLNKLLKAINERLYDHGTQEIEIPLRSLWTGSNELPGHDREELMAFRDRLPITMLVEPVRGRDERIAIMRGQLERRNSSPTLTQMTLAELDQAHEEAVAVEVPDQVLEAMAKLVQMTEDATSGGYVPSMRRVGESIKLMQARAWTRGNTEVDTDDMIVCQHTFWLDPEHREAAYKNVMEFANAFVRKAMQIRDSFDPVLQQLEAAKNKVADNGGVTEEDDLTTFFEIKKQLRTLDKETAKQVGLGKSEGHDVSDLEALHREIADTGEAVKKTLLAEDDDEDDE